MINDIKGEKRIDLFYSIQNFDSDKEIAVIRMLKCICIEIYDNFFIG